MKTKKWNWKNSIWVIIEIMISVSIYYLIQWILKNTKFPFTNDMMSGILRLLIITGIIYGIAVYGFIKIDQLITKTKLNMGKGILFLIGGVILSLGGMNLLMELNVINANFPLFLFILIVIAIPVLGLNYGLRMKNH